MNVVNGFKRYMYITQLRAWSKAAGGSQLNSLGNLHQRRNYRYDDRYNRISDSTQHKKGSRVYSDDGFDPRYNDHYFRRHHRSNEYGQRGDGVKYSAKDPDSRRRITQDSTDHKQRQERIINENRARWQNRSDPKISNALYNKVYGDRRNRSDRAIRPRKDDEFKTAEEYSRRRRQQRQQDVERQERQLRELRKDYNLPKSEYEEQEDQATAESDHSPYANEAKFAKPAKDTEEQYWRSWNSCPAERQQPLAEEQSYENSLPSYEPNQRRGLARPTQLYDGSVRRYQTSTGDVALDSMPTVIPPKNVSPDDAFRFRKSNVGSDDGLNSIMSIKRLENSLPKVPLRTDVFKKPAKVYAKQKQEEKAQKDSRPMQSPLIRQTWEGLPRPAYRRYDAIKKAIDARQMRRAESKTNRSVHPPHFDMNSKQDVVKRKRTPIESFSDKLSVTPDNIPHSQYTGYGRQTVCDAWQNFTNVYTKSTN